MNFKEKSYQVIFEHDTFAGKAFDVVLIIFVLLSVLAVSLETVQGIFGAHKQLFDLIEWFFTFAFTLELGFRLYCSPDKKKYITSFYGVIDVLSILPSYLSILMPGAEAFIIIRALRLLRIFRILKLSHYTNAGTNLKLAIVGAKPKIIVFIFFVCTFVTIVGTLMYYIEGSENGFTSIPKSIYWAIVTMTTVGYGDVVPHTVLGQLLASLLMITGYGVIAVPTGILSTEMAKLENKPGSAASVKPTKQRKCPHCGQSADYP